jgi:serine/threonine-protein kinase
MEFLHGVPLDARLAERGRLSQVETLELLEAILAPLEAAHAAGVIHRDLKPGNVFLQKLADGKDFPRILDFGLARHVDSTGRGSGIVGTPSYMAPEQAKEGDLTPAADLYALGCMAYEMLSGALPFEAPTAFGVIEKHLTRTPAPLDSLVMNLDDDVVALVQALMQKDPAKRPTARQARRDVARLLRALARAATVGDARPAPVGIERVAARPGAPSEAATELGIAGVDVPLPPPRRAQPPSNFSSRPTVRDAPALSHEDESARRSPWSRWVVGGLLAAMGLAALAKWVA